MSDIIRYPTPLQEFLDIPGIKGTRNDRLFKAAIQARDCRFTESDCLALLLPLAVDRDGLDERGARATIHSAYMRDPRELPHGVAYDDGKGPIYIPPKRKSVTEKPTTATGTGAKYKFEPDFKLPDPIEEPTKLFLKTIFKPGERIQLVRGIVHEDEEKEVPSASDYATFPLEFWLDKLEKAKGNADKAFFYASDGPHGMFFSTNPLGEKKDSKGKHIDRKASNIADYRYALVEFDHCPLEQQYQLLIQSRLPLAAIYYSGDKSIHGLVKFYAKDKKQWDERWLMIQNHFKDYEMDEQNKDATRLSRLPGRTRGDTGKKQTLLALNTGLATFEEWQAEQAISSSDLPTRMPTVALRVFDFKNDPDTLIGKDRFLGKKTSFLVTGHSGIGKSSWAMQAALCWAVGRSFLPREDGTGGLEAKRLIKTVIVQSENDLGDMAEALQGIEKALEFSDKEKALVDKNVIIYQDTSRTGEEFIKMLYSIIALEHDVDQILIDPLFAVVGADITKAEVIGKFFRQGLNTLMQVTGVMVTFMHHIPKPSDNPQFKKEGHNLIYAGAGSAELVNWARATAVLQPHNGYFQLIIGKRKDRTGMLNDDGEPTDCLELAHGEGGIFWKRLDKGTKDALEEAEAARKRAEKEANKKKKEEEGPAHFTAGQVLKFAEYLKANPTASQNIVVEAAMPIFGIKSDRTMRNLLKQFISDKRVEEIDTGKKSGKSTTKNYKWVG